MVPRNLPLASKRSRRSSHLARQPHLPLKLARADTTLSAETMSIDHVASHPGPGGPCIWSSPVQSLQVSVIRLGLISPSASRSAPSSFLIEPPVASHNATHTTRRPRPRGHKGTSLSA